MADERAELYCCPQIEEETMSSMEPVPSDKVRNLIDVVNLLRSIGSKNLVLPSIAVIGDKGSGKTSVLEALSGVMLPRGKNYSIHLQMNKTNGGELNGMVKYLGNDFTSPQEKRIGPQHRQDVPDLIRSCLNSYRNWEGLTVFLEIFSPDVPDLTLMDLPSIPPEGNKTGGRDQIKEQIKQMIKNPETLILMVVPCNVDISTTEAFRMVQEVDPDGDRTLGLLTKPDLVDQVKEKTIVETVQNKVFNLKKGFMVVRCYDQTEMSLMDPIEKELKFFKEHALFKSFYDDGRATLPKLAARLSQELAQHIQKHLPQMKEYVQKELQEAKDAIKRLGKPPPSDEADNRSFLTDKLNSFIQDVMRLTTGELLDITEQQVFSVWRKIVKDSEESFQCKLEAEVALHEHLGSSDFQTFDHVIKDQLRLLEESAVFTLNNSADIVRNELLKLIEKTFLGLPNLISKAERKISNVTSRNKKAAESLLRTQFKMELFEVHAEGRMCTTKKREKKKSPTAQLYSYYQAACQHLTRQVQMMIHFHMFTDLSSELQKNMLQLLEDKNISYIVEYDYNLTQLRNNIQKCFIPLTKAQIMLSEM